MAVGLGDVIASKITGCDSYIKFSSNMLSGIQSFLNIVFTQYMSPRFMVMGVITTPSGVSSPITGPLGTLQSFTLRPILGSQYRRIMKPSNEGEIKSYQYYVRLGKVIKQVLSPTYCSLNVNINPIGAMLPVPIPAMSFNAAAFGAAAQSYMMGVQAPTMPQWTFALNNVGKMLLTNILPTTVTYAGPCAAGSFTGTITIQYLPV